MNNKFFCSEEHAKEYCRRSNRDVDGAYMTLEQNIYSTDFIQGSVFNFDVIK